MIKVDDDYGCGDYDYDYMFIFLFDSVVLGKT